MKKKIESHNYLFVKWKLWKQQHKQIFVADLIYKVCWYAVEPIQIRLWSFYIVQWETLDILFAWIYLHRKKIPSQHTDCVAIAEPLKASQHKHTHTKNDNFQIVYNFEAWPDCDCCTKSLLRSIKVTSNDLHPVVRQLYKIIFEFFVVVDEERCASIVR